VSRASWPNAVKQLHDRLVDMGFEDSEADAFIEKVPQLDLPGGAGTLFSLPRRRQSWSWQKTLARSPCHLKNRRR
jgi:hypothetical protein